ncbi:UNKNOWN [Stylonychia lemnae]|uniref:Uncharacterized protein n=1 Tax=Stylonychia lemnae TaxID=5949 RepID=A0A078A2D6_STYLE|nr:UNKNOWN [Stylonychia lemnae]|eukprot:CDW74939.1 UNKNOWN [Stylonychia lemnae]
MAYNYQQQQPQQQFQYEFEDRSENMQFGIEKVQGNVFNSSGNKVQQTANVQYNYDIYVPPDATQSHLPQQNQQFQYNYEAYDPTGHQNMNGASTQEKQKMHIPSQNTGIYFNNQAIQQPLHLQQKPQVLTTPQLNFQPPSLKDAEKQHKSAPLKTEEKTNNDDTYAKASILDTAGRDSVITKKSISKKRLSESEQKTCQCSIF